MSDPRDDDLPIEPNDPLTADGFDEDAVVDDDEPDTDEAVERRPDGEMGME